MTTTGLASTPRIEPITELRGAPFGRRLPRAAVLTDDPARGARALHAALDDAGAVLVAGCSPEDFVRLTNAIGRDFLVHPSRVREATALDPSIQTVEYGNLALKLHCEMGYFPTRARPGLACFYCREPARDGGATTLADGALFARRLSRATRQLFEAERLWYRHRIPIAQWRTIERGLGPRSFATGPSERFRAERTVTPEGDVMLTECVTPALVARADGTTVFLNSILASLDPTNTEAYRIYTLTLESGRAIPDDVLKELHAVAEEVTVPVHWRAGDALVVDNFRVMHGRTAFAGPRAVWARFGDDARRRQEAP